MKAKVLITAGPTREWMDPVRFLSNPSTGAMGIEIARAMRKIGFDVTLILGPTSLKAPDKVKVVRVETALEMFRAVQKNLWGCFAFVATAAVGDWRFAKTSSRKMKRSDHKTTRVHLIGNPDILAWVGKQKLERPPLVIGFALETEKVRAHATKKLKEKNLDLIVANAPDSFGSSRIRGLWIEESRVWPIKSGSKWLLADLLASWVKDKWKTTTR